MGSEAAKVDDYKASLITGIEGRFVLTLFTVLACKLNLDFTPFSTAVLILGIILLQLGLSWSNIILQMPLKCTVQLAILSLCSKT